MPVTYEELFDALRNERKSEELQPLKESFYSDVIAYLEEKKRILESQGEEAALFSSEKHKVRIQLENAKKIVKELFERREKKIINMALDRTKARTDIVDTSSLLAVEKAFFENAAQLFAEYKQGVLAKLFSLQAPEYSGVKENSPNAKQGNDETQEAEQDSRRGKVTVRFKKEVPKFLGFNSEVYGPFKEEETVSLDLEVAEMLIKNGSAEKVE